MSISKYVQAVLDGSGKKSILSFFGSMAFGKMIVDGNMG